MSHRTNRVLIVGRTGTVLLDAVTGLRERGYGANASNQFETLLEDYDLREVDLVVFGGMVPPEMKDQLRSEISELNPEATYLQGLGGIASLLVAQIEEFFTGAATGVEYDSPTRVVRVTLTDASPVSVEGFWATIRRSEPVEQSSIAFDGELSAGVHEIGIPDVVPREGSFAAVRIGERVSAFRIGETSQAAKRIAGAPALPAPEPVTTSFPWSEGAPAR